MMPQERSVNIDEKFDLTMVELLIKNGFCDNYPERLVHKYDELNIQNFKNIKNLITYDLSKFNRLKKIFDNKKIIQVDKISKKDLVKVLKS